MMRSKRNSLYGIFLGVLFFVMMSGCANNERSDAYGQFEAVETTVSAKASGELLSFTISEGEAVSAGKQVAVIDTVQSSLKREELASQREAAESQIDNIDAEIAVQQQKLETAQKNLERIRAMREDEAATVQQLDDAEGKVQTIQKQIEALESQKKSARAEIKTIGARLNQVKQQLNDTHVMNPVNGTVLTTFVEQHELVGQGQPLYQIANLDTLDLRVYISGAQLPSVKLGQQVEVLVDKNADENQSMSGHISWIASDAEFTPKMIQTKEERVTQVYAVKVKVPNPDGILKIGMPGEVNF
ncbi:HlyD family secretion protein [Aliifodinibius salipaludis]|uniref:HlyD family secretion protein n=1 Tax=Fodinibius salipaludis TaxID=2032627 RepID=A0A2A2G994_9BACT|nr:HlyD family efflux transporter periplasmic adaptor subunit [Aliifodinibius salipaludis]PAU93413.1 HlyD family secretion protein [Aliifodinibius salipaludis]